MKRHTIRFPQIQLLASGDVFSYSVPEGSPMLSFGTALFAVTCSADVADRRWFLSHTDRSGFAIEAGLLPQSPVVASSLAIIQFGGGDSIDVPAVTPGADAQFSRLSTDWVAPIQGGDLIRVTLIASAPVSDTHGEIVLVLMEP